jgi:hypothetical protein
MLQELVSYLVSYISSSNLATSWMTVKTGFASLQGQKVFLFLTELKLAVGPIQPSTE